MTRSRIQNTAALLEKKTLLDPTYSVASLASGKFNLSSGEDGDFFTPISSELEQIFRENFIQSEHGHLFAKDWFHSVIA